MLTVSSDFKNALQEPVKSVLGYLTDGDTTYDSDGDLEYFTIKGVGKLLDTSMRQIDIVLQGEHQLIGHALTAYYGVLMDEYEYEPQGVFNILKAEYKKDSDTTHLVGYDNMVLLQKSYTPVSDFPTTLFEFTQALCASEGLTLVNTELYNGALPMPEDYWATIPDITKRDVLREICEVTVSVARANSAGNIELIPIDNPTGETLTYDNFLKHSIGDKYGGVNSLVLSRQPQNDDIYMQDIVDIRYPMNRNILDLEAFNVGYQQ